MRRISFLSRAFDDFTTWANEDRKIYSRIVELIKDVERSPFSGIGKPEPLKHNLKGLWSRRITSEHRLTYQVKDEDIVIVQCRFHYKK